MTDERDGELAEGDPSGDGITRGDLLKGAAGPAPGCCSAAAPPAPPRRPRAPAAARRQRRKVAGMNVLVFMTDQQRAIQHFPPGWAKRNMPGLTRLQQHGMTFDNAFTNACMCSPARSTLMSGYFPAQHGVKYTLEERHAGAAVPAGRARHQLQEPRARSRPPPATPRSTRGSSTASSRRTARPGCPPTSTSTASRAGIRRTRAPTRTSRRRAAGSTTTTAAS